MKVVSGYNHLVLPFKTVNRNRPRWLTIFNNYPLKQLAVINSLRFAEQPNIRLGTRVLTRSIDY
jgi:hypothetical protein